MGCGNSTPSPDEEVYLHTSVNGSTITGTPPRQCQGRADVTKMDSNKGGVVDEAEFVAAGGSTQEFGRYDTNQDGARDVGELAARAAALEEDQCAQLSGEPVKASAAGPYRDDSFPAAQSSLGNLLDQQGDSRVVAVSG